MSDAPHLPAREDAPQATGGGPTTKSQPAGARPFFSRIFGSPAGATASRTPSNVRDARRAIALCHVLLSERGEVSGLRLAREVLSAYRSFDALTLDAFFDLLVKEFSPDPYEIDRAIRPHLRAELIRSCAYYLLHTKHGKAPLDPVTRFHLANGARLERLNWLGDISEKGMQQSVGLMVNYVYHSREMDRNHEAYAKDYRIIASHELERLAKQCLIAHSRSG